MRNVKTLSILILLVLGQLATGTVHAQSSYATDEQNRRFVNFFKHATEQPELTQRHRFDMGTEISQMRYKDAGDKKAKGMAYGIYGIYNFRLSALESAINVFHVDTHVNYSRMDYKTSQTNPNGDLYGDFDGAGDFMVEPRFWVGRDLEVTENSRLTPYAGIGYRYYLNRLKDKISSIGGYGRDRRSQYLYVPIGAEFAFIPAQGWEIGLNGEYDVLIRGWQTTYTSQQPTGVSVGYPNLDNIQNHGYGVRGSLDIIKRSDRFNFLVSPYFRYWSIEESKFSSAINEDATYFATSEGVVPENKTTEMGVKLGVQF